MIKQVIRLIKPGLFLPNYVNEEFKNDSILIRPKWLSICAADQRYFQGNRPKEVLERKLPMSLFHEAVGVVIYDPEHKLKVGSYCVLMPGDHSSLSYEGNYKQGAFFRSSNTDGFAQEFIFLKKNEIIPINDDNAEKYIFSELLSVCCQAISRIEFNDKKLIDETVGIWGDGSMAYIMALAIKYTKPNCKIIIHGKHEEKLMLFSFVDKKISIYDNKNFVPIDVAIECVGGLGAQNAISQAINNLNPCGKLLLMGVSEISPQIPTRKILEKGLIIIGASRSTKLDFQNSVDLIHNTDISSYFPKIISLKEKFSSAFELREIFIKDIKYNFKTVLEINF